MSSGLTRSYRLVFTVRQEQREVHLLKVGDHKSVYGRDLERELSLPGRTCLGQPDVRPCRKRKNDWRHFVSV